MGLHWKRAVRVRRQHGLHVRLFDLHGVVGVWAIPWLAVFAITGALSGLGALATVTLAPVVFPDQPGQVFAQLMGPPSPGAAGEAWHNTPGLDALLQADRQQHPDFLPQALVLHHWGDVNASVEIAGMTRGVPSTAVFERCLYRASDTALLHRASARGRGIWLQAFIAIQPLHFAQYAWVPAANLWYGLHLLMGLAACVLTATGLYLWVRRHHRRQPRAARLLAALAVGVCAGLVLNAGVLLVAGQLQAAGCWRDSWNAPVFWSVWSLVILIAFIRTPSATLLRGFMRAGGLIHLLAALLHMSLTLVNGSPFMDWQVDALLALLGVTLLRSIQDPFDLQPLARNIRQAG